MFEEDHKIGFWIEGNEDGNYIKIPKKSWKENKHGDWVTYSFSRNKDKKIVRKKKYYYNLLIEDISFYSDGTLFQEVYYRGINLK